MDVYIAEIDQYTGRAETGADALRIAAEWYEREFGPLTERQRCSAGLARSHREGMAVWSASFPHLAETAESEDDPHQDGATLALTYDGSYSRDDVFEDARTDWNNTFALRIPFDYLPGGTDRDMQIVPQHSKATGERECWVVIFPAGFASLLAELNAGVRQPLPA